jgi:hypothetical protein
MARLLQRTVHRTLCLTPAEDAALTERRGGRDFSPWARAALSGLPLPSPSQKPPPPIIIQRRMSEFEARKIQQLAWIGNNLNQIARHTNAGTATGIDTLVALVSFERETRRAADAL